ncbi:hypothetical protein EZV62_008359 [Acer yangbiense]|uniref:NAC domain-containing protein n=1 Tax=Acer yangbiense TaxID=1000413 RepID=A0A5C7IDC2_9ROSI|nr:hypothetical protein EZV62_008359 [Acer yangbiense]
MGIQETDPLTQLNLPPGFRFYPTDEELLVQYLCRKVAGHHFSLEIIGEIDLYKFDPWVLPDEWVLCRIYRKNSSAQKPVSMTTTSVSSKEHSNGSCSSSSSHLDDVLDSLPEIDDRFFTLPRMNSLKNLQNDEKLNLQQLGSGNFDWASLAGLNSVTELGHNSGQNQSQGMASYGNNDVYVPSLPQLCHVDSGRVVNSVDEEVQSGLRTQYLQQNSGMLSQNFSNSLDPYGFRYPNQPGGFGFRQ